MSYLYVPPADKIVRRVAVGKAPRPAGRDGIDAAAEDAHDALLLAPWEVSDKAPHMPVHEYDRTIPDGDAWKGVYGYDDTARTLRVACGAVCYTFPIPPDAMAEDAESGKAVAGVESLTVRVIGDRYLDKGAKVYVAFTEAVEPPSLAAFVAAAEGVASSDVVCATATQEVTPNERKGLRDEAEIDYGETPATPASFCHVCLALADYDDARGAWVEGGAQLDPESIGVTFDREISSDEPLPTNDPVAIANLDLGMTTDTPPTGESLPSGAGAWSPDKSMATSSVSRGQYSYHLFNAGDEGDDWNTQDAWGYWYVDSMVGRTGDSVVKKFLSDILLGYGVLMTGYSDSGNHLPSKAGPLAGNRGYGVISTYGHEAYVVSVFSRSGFVEPGTWHALSFNTPLVALCDLRLVLLGGYITKRYSTGNSENQIEWAEIKPNFTTAMALLRGDGSPLKLIPPDPSIDGPTDDMLSRLAVVDVKKDKILRQIAFDAPVTTDAQYPNLFTMFAAVFPLGVGGGSYPTQGAQSSQIQNNITVSSLLLKDQTGVVCAFPTDSTPPWENCDKGKGYLRCSLSYLNYNTEATTTIHCGIVGTTSYKARTFQNPSPGKPNIRYGLKVQYGADQDPQKDNFFTGNYSYYKKTRTDNTPKQPYRGNIQLIRSASTFLALCSIRRAEQTTVGNMSHTTNTQKRQ